MLFKNFITIFAAFLTIVSINLLANDPSKAMFSLEDEREKSKPTLSSSKSQQMLEGAEIKEEKNDILYSVPMHQNNSLLGILPGSWPRTIFLGKSNG
jgi:hypothetical protein